MGLSIIVFIMIVWWRDVIRESTYQGKHTLVVKWGIKYGMVFSEVCLLFFRGGGAFFRSSLSAVIEVGGVRPPTGVDPLNFKAIPLLN